VRPPPEAAGADGADGADGAPFRTSAPAIVPGAFAAGGKSTRDGTGTTGAAAISLRPGPSAGGTTAWTVLGVNTGAAWVAAGWDVGEPALPNSTTPSAAPALTMHSAAAAHEPRFPVDDAAAEFIVGAAGSQETSCSADQARAPIGAAGTAW
jgi:hypothetical protein